MQSVSKNNSGNRMFTIVRKSLWADIGFPARDRKLKIILENLRAPFGNGNKGKEILQMVGIGPGKMIMTNVEKVLKVGRMTSIEISGGDQTTDVRYTGGC